VNLASTSQLGALAFPNVDPIAFRLGPLAVHWYGLAYLSAFVGAILLARWLGQRWKLGLTDDDLLTILLASIIGVPAEILAIWDGGMSFHGGLVGILVAGVVAARMLRMPWLTLCDLGSVGAPIGFGLGRLANFINGELWGRVTDVPWAMVFPAAGALPRHPSQLYEALLEGALLFFVMLVLARKLPPRPRGELLGWLLALYGSFRVGVELFRQPDAQIGFLPAGITMGQLLSVPMLVGGIALIYWARVNGLAPGGPGSVGRD